MPKKRISWFCSKKDQYTLFPNFKLEKKNSTKTLFSLQKMELKSSSIAKLINDFAAHFIKYLNSKYAYKN
jgi:hypothetical protein